MNVSGNGNGNQEFAAIPTAALHALIGKKNADMEIFLTKSADHGPVLYRKAGVGLDLPDIERMNEHGVSRVFVRLEDFHTCEKALEHKLDMLLANPHIAPTEKAAIVQSAGKSVARDLSKGPVTPATIERASNVVNSMIGSVLVDPFISASLLKMAGHERTTASHMFVVATLAVMLGAEIYGEDRDKLTELGFAGMLHDIGKLSIPSSILNKTGPLSREELTLIHQHPIESVRIAGEDSHITPDVRQMILQHHERMDGRGYPIGIAGSELFMGSRLLSIVDCFHALIGRRCYRSAMEPADANRVLITQSDKQFDPELLRIWTSLCERCEARSPAEENIITNHSKEELSTRHEHRPVPPGPSVIAQRPTRYECRGNTIVQCAHVGRLMETKDPPEQFGAVVRDLSRSGLCMYTAHAMYRGEIVNIRITSHGGFSWVASMVAWCRRKDANVYKIGLRFLDRISEQQSSQPVVVKPLHSTDVGPAMGSAASDDKAIDKTAKIMEKPVTDRRESALKSLAAIESCKEPSRDARQTAVTLAMSGDVEVRLKAMEVLMRIRGRMAREALVCLLTDNHLEIKERAIAAAAALKLVEAVGPLRGLLRDPVQRVALRAAGALGKLGDESGLRLVAETLERNAPEARLAAQAFGDITGHKFSANREGIRAARRYLSAKSLLAAK